MVKRTLEFEEKRGAKAQASEWHLTVWLPKIDFVRFRLTKEFKPSVVCYS